MEAETCSATPLMPIKEQTAVLGGLLWLCQHSHLHCNYSVGMLLTRVSISIELNQYRYYEDGDGVPVGFCNWAWLSDPDLTEALDGKIDFDRKRWQSGKNLFFPEFLAPFGHCRTIVRDIRQNVVPADIRGWSLRGQFNQGEQEAQQKVHRFVNC